MKAIFVDGASFSWMRQPLGIGKFDLGALYRLLKNIGGQSAYKKPTYTLNQQGEETVGKTLRTLGFETVVCARGEDDKAIVDRIRQLDPAEIGEVILLSADQDYVEVLREKAAQGMKIFQVATRQLTEDGNSMIAGVLDEIFQSGEFNFVELLDYKHVLMREPWGTRPSRREREAATAAVTAVAPVQRNAKISLTLSGDSDEVTSALTEVMRLIRKYPSMKFTIEG